MGWTASRGHAGRDRGLYVFPHLAVRRFFSRIGFARVRFDGLGNPWRRTLGVRPGVRLIANCLQAVGCENLRIAYVEPLQHYMMTYTPLSRRGPRIAIAMLDDPHLRKKRRANPLRCQWIFVEKAFGSRIPALAQS